jgi:CRP/FNR family transcriptional regulator, cyclic AMP receptor protein
MLENVSLFLCLTIQERAELEAISQKRSVAKNTILISDGDKTDSIYIIETGKAHAIRSDESGRQVIINRFGPLDYFGEMSFFDGKSRCATVITKTRCELLVIPRNAFSRLVTNHPEILTNIINALLDKLRKATQKIEELAFLDVYGRLANFLSENKNDEGLIEEPMTQQEIADIVGSSRETVCRILSELADGGYISRKKNQITLLKGLPYKF